MVFREMSLVLEQIFCVSRYDDIYQTKYFKEQKEAEEYIMQQPQANRYTITIQWVVKDADNTNAPIFLLDRQIEISE